MREKYTATVDPWVLRHARRVAAARGTTVASLIDEGLLRLIAEHDERQMEAAAVPPLPGDDDAEQLRAADHRRTRGAA